MGLSVKLRNLQLKTVPGSSLDLEIGAGERIGITGQNGGGKSSLLRYLACLERPVAMGQLLLEGLDPFHSRDMEKLHRRVAAVLQDPAEGMVFSDVQGDAIFGPENLAVEPEVIRRRWKGLSERLLRDLRGETGASGKEDSADGGNEGRIRRKKKQKHGNAAAPDKPRRNFAEMSGGQQQRAAMVSALMMRAPLLLMDEPFSMLGKEEGGEILKLLLDISGRIDQTLILVSRDPEVLARMDRVFSLEEGKLREMKSVKGAWLYMEEGTEDAPEIREGTEVNRKSPLKTGFPEDEAREDDQGGRETKKGEKADPGMPRLTQAVGISFPGDGTRELKLPEAHPPLITLENVAFRHGTREVLRDFSCAVYPGRFYKLVGGTGSGKTTICRLMNGTLRADSGEIRVKGELLPRGREKRSRKRHRQTSMARIRCSVGLVMQHPEEQLFAASVLEDVMYGPLRAGRGKDEARQDAEEALRSLGVSEKLWDRDPERLSGGEKRKAAIAGILALRPEVLLLDEPYAGLDPEGREELRDVLFHQVRQGRTVIVTCHESEEE